MDETEVKKGILAMVNDDKVFNPIAEEAFNVVDTDSSGLIDKDEFKKCSIQVAKSFGLKEPDEANIEEIYNRLDADGNGSIDSDEFKKYVKQLILIILDEM